MIRTLTNLIVSFWNPENHSGDGRLSAAVASEGESWSRGWFRL